MFTPVVIIKTTPSGLNREEKEYFVLKKGDRITVGCPRKNPQLMRSNKDMTMTPHRACVAKAIIGKGKIFV